MATLHEPGPEAQSGLEVGLFGSQLQSKQCALMSRGRHAIADNRQVGKRLTKI